LRPVFPVSRVQHISDMHSKFALGPHHVHCINVALWSWPWYGHIAMWMQSNTAAPDALPAAKIKVKVKASHWMLTTAVKKCNCF